MRKCVEIPLWSPSRLLLKRLHARNRSTTYALPLQKLRGLTCIHLISALACMRRAGLARLYVGRISVTMLC